MYGRSIIGLAMPHPSLTTLELYSFNRENLFSVVRRIVMPEGRPDVAEADNIVARGRCGRTGSFVLSEQPALQLGGDQTQNSDTFTLFCLRHTGCIQASRRDRISQ